MFQHLNVSLIQNLSLNPTLSGLFDELTLCNQLVLRLFEFSNTTVLKIDDLLKKV